jgi:hypothetical protein
MGGEQVQQQAAHDRHRETGVYADGFGVHAEAVGLLDHWLHPAVNDVVEEGDRARAPLERLNVQLVEESLVGPQRRVRQAAPHRAHGVAARQARVGEQVVEKRALGVFDGLHDGKQQAFARAEVVDEHTVAGADRGGHLAQAEVDDAVVLNVVDDEGEEPIAGRDGGRHLTQASTLCTMWYMYRLVHRPVGIRGQPLMHHFHFSAERLIQAPVDVVYHCLADYREHHRVDGGFLPPTFTSLDVLEGGFGAGTLIRFTTSVGGRSTTRTQRVSEPEPGRVLVESGDGEGSTFTLAPQGDDATRLRIETTLNAPGLEGVFIRLFGARVLKPLYADEMARLESYAQAHAAVAAA